MPVEQIPGVVYLVGAGPGDPGLLTLRGAECLGRADVVVYDRLANPDLLKHAADSVELIFAGKQASQHTLRQSEINEILVDRALAGKSVCRLKGGDPFVFGRGGEEAEACVEAGVPFEVVPGVTSAIAGPAYSGIPITHRSASSSFAVVTGHEDPEKPESRIHWEHLAHAADTLVFVMGVDNLASISEQLQAAGKAGNTPAALIRWATWPRQETLVSTLANLARDADEAGFGSPAVAVIGDVVKLRESLRWFDRKPLFGTRILVTRSREQASGLSSMLRERGAEPVEFPLIRIERIADNPALDSALSSLTEYQWIVLTSANAVEAVWEHVTALGADARILSPCRIAAVGPATTEALGRIGIRPDFVPSKFTSESLADEWPERDLKGSRILLLRPRQAPEVLPDRLREMGAMVTVVPVYETVIDAEGADSIRRQLEEKSIDAVTFTSSSTVINYVDSIGREAAVGLLEGVKVASIGPMTTQTAGEHGIRVDLEADEHSIPGLVRKLEDRLNQSSARK